MVVPYRDLIDKSGQDSLPDFVLQRRSSQTTEDGMTILHDLDDLSLRMLSETRAKPIATGRLRT